MMELKIKSSRTRALMNKKNMKNEFDIIGTIPIIVIDIVHLS